MYVNIEIELTSTGYSLTVNEWFIGGYKTLQELQEKVAEQIRNRL